MQLLKDVNEPTLLLGLRLTRMDHWRTEPRSARPAHVARRKRCLFVNDGVGLLCHGGMGSLFGVCCRQLVLRGVFCDSVSLWTLE